LVTGSPLSHVGFIVEDLDKAMARFSEVLGITFNEPRTVHLDHLHDPTERTGVIRVAFSKEGPPHYELIQGDGRGIYAMPDGGEGMHHVGVWETHLEERMKELAEKGLTVEARVMLDDGTMLTAFNNADDLHGVRIEFVDDADQGAKEAFMKNGPSDTSYDKFSYPGSGEVRL
jgi:catechol 2,3-dioxygenase-like lactoylglutathione lyase family enzyme